MEFAISTDSNSDFTAKEIKDLNLYVGKLSFTITENGKLTEYLDDFKTDEEYHEFYDKLRNGAISKTSILNLQAHIDLFTSMAKAGIKNALHISQSMGLSPTLKNAEAAILEVKKQFPDINYIAMESNTTTVAEGNLVKTAIALRDQGKTLNETLEILEKLKKQTQHFVIVSDLMYLKRGGRISGAKATLGSLLNLKPIIEFNKQGKLDIIRKVSGMKKAMKSIITEVKENFTVHKEFGNPIVAHTDNLELANTLAEMYNNEFGVMPEIRMVGPIIGTHVGPDAVALTFLSNEERMY